MSEEAAKEKKKPLLLPSKEQVLAYLIKHPEFLLENPQLVEVLKAPKTDRGEGVADLQHYMVGGLQKELRDLKEKYGEMVEFCRSNMSTQAQVHSAVANLMHARSLEQLLQLLTVDLVSLFDVDVVRIAMETEGADMYETSYPEAHYSGISFIEYGTVDAALGAAEDILLVEDTHANHIPGFEEIFSDCTALVRSCALLRLHLDTVQKDVLLSFGVRTPGRFHPHMGVELLSFLAHIVESRLDVCLNELDPDALA